MATVDATAVRATHYPAIAVMERGRRLLADRSALDMITVRLANRMIPSERQPPPDDTQFVDALAAALRWRRRYVRDRNISSRDRNISSRDDDLACVRDQGVDA
jgi:hypothetical protein